MLREMTKNELIQCFFDSVNISEHILKTETEKAIKSNKVYKEDFITERQNDSYAADIIVEANTSFKAAKEYLKYGKVAVLNFANPHNPGGGVHNGAMAQEECLCRSSNLYSCLSNANVFNEYYLYHKNMEHYFFSDRLIYTKDVTVFKDDSDVPQIMPKEDWFNVDVITCAAPYIAKRKYTNKTALKELLKSRIKNIIEAAIDNQVDVLILGAFGCGAFKNPPEVVAKAFHEEIDENNYKDYFSKIVFAIKSTVNDDPYFPCPNIMAFEQEFYTLSAEASKLRFSDPYPFEQALGEIKMPSERILKGGKQFNPYLEWKNDNKYFGKQFSILGDSISTLEGFNPKGYNIFYKGKFSGDEKSCKANVHEMEDTWWGKVIDFFGGELLVNNSWSGSRVTKLPSQNEILFPSGCSDERTSSLHINNIMPDVILVYFGTNDWAFGARRNDKTRVPDIDEMEYFESAYDEMLKKLKNNYPKAEIWCCTLCATKMSTNPSFSFPENYNGNDINYYNNAIRNIVQKSNCKLIDLYSNQIPYDSIDGSHPNADGMNVLAVQIIREMSDEKGASFLDCQTEHDYIRLDGYYDVMAYKCRKCGKEKMENAYINPDCDTYLTEDEQINNKGFCSKCGAAINEKDRFCSKCGNRLEDDKSPYIWNSVYMSTENISEFTVSFGDCPIVHISFDGENLTVYNRINGSRDGYMAFPDGFFDDKIAFLRDEQKTAIKKYIKTIDFSHWKTEDYIRENYENGACGFCINNSFTCKFNSGETFKCYEPENKAFYQLVDYLKEFCDNSWFEHYYEKIDDIGENTVLLTEKFDPQYKYADMDLNMTRCLFDNTLKLFSESKAEEIVLKQDVISIGRDENCDIKLNCAEISKQHARFYHEGSTWFIADTNSTNGIWLNGNKIEPNTKYELFSDDMIDIAHIDKFVFYKVKTDGIFPIKQQPIILTAGTELDGKYELLKQIGQGTFTKTYLAVDKRLNKMWAAKICVKNNSSMNIIEAIMNEAYMVKKLVHKAIPHIVDIIDNNEYFCIIEDYVEGATLKDIVDNYGAQPQYKVIDWAKQLCDVLGYLHAKNPPHIYRDLKPGNVILKPDGNIVIIDFGIMRTYKPNNLADTVALGTKGYAAPEQYGTRQTDARTDIFGLGMTIHHLLTGVDPTENNGCTLPICQIKSELSKGLEYIVSKCIELAPENRYQSCLELLNDLNRYQQLPPKQNLFSKILGKK